MAVFSYSGYRSDSIRPFRSKNSFTNEELSPIIRLSMNGNFQGIRAGSIGKRGVVSLCLLLLAVSLAYAEHAQRTGNNVVTHNHAFSPGEVLTYSISWSNIVEAGIAKMEVKRDDRNDGAQAYRLVSTARSVGMVAAFYTVRDTVQSVLDTRELYSLSYHLDQTHGRRKKKRQSIFDHEAGTVVVMEDGKKETFDIPPRVHDALSSMYYLRTRTDFSTDHAIIIDVFDSGKNWAVEVHTLGRETIKTALGEFKTIKVKTYPKYEGVFLHKGEIIIWLTDDNRKIPVLMKSKITIGSIVATLTEIKQGAR